MHPSTAALESGLGGAWVRKSRDRALYDGLDG